jgi:acyl-CoA thioesterase-1
MHRTPEREWVWRQCTQALAVLLVLTACGRDRTPQLPRLASDAKILAYGDSLTAGTGASPETSYPAQLQRIVGRSVINGGVPGETTTGGLERLGAALDEHEPQLVILCLGGNDMLHQQDRAQMRANLRTMIEQIRARGLPLVLLGVPEPKLIGLSSEPMYAELAREFRLPLEDNVLSLVLSDRQLKADQIHANEKGYRLIAEAVAALLRKTGAV